MNQPPPLSRPVYIPNHLVWAILTTLFCCLPLGVVSIVYASQVDTPRGWRSAGAYSASRKAGWWAVASAVALPVLLLLWLGLFGGLAVLGALSDQ